MNCVNPDVKITHNNPSQNKCFHQLTSPSFLLASPNISTKGITHSILQVTVQVQALVVHVSVISASIFLRNKAVKQGATFGLTD